MPAGDRVRFDVLKPLGYFVTESSEHFSEYTPWYIKDGRDDLIDRSRFRSMSISAAARRRSRKWHELRAGPGRG